MGVCTPRFPNEGRGRQNGDRRSSKTPRRSVRCTWPPRKPAKAKVGPPGVVTLFPNRGDPSPDSRDAVRQAGGQERDGGEPGDAVGHYDCRVVYALTTATATASTIVGSRHYRSTHCLPTLTGQTHPYALQSHGRDDRYFCDGDLGRPGASVSRHPVRAGCWRRWQRSIVTRSLALVRAARDAMPL